MTRGTAKWGAAFFGVAAFVLFLVGALFRGPVAAEVSVRRDPAMSAVDRELIRNKVREGDLRWIKKDREGARAAWAEARRMGEGLWAVHEWLGDSALRAGLHGEAAAEYGAAEAAVSEPQVRSTMAVKRGLAHSAGGQPLEAVRAWLESGQAGPLAARLIEEAKKADRAAVVRAVSQRAEIHDARLFALLAILHQGFGQKAEAAEAMAKYSILAAPWDEANARTAVLALRAEKKIDRAVEVCRAWVRAVPSAIQAYLLMGSVLHEAGREKEAVAAWTSIVDIRPGDAEAHRILGGRFEEIGRLDDALAQYEAARKARPEDQVTYTTLAGLYEQKGDAARAEEILLEACKRFGTVGETRSKLVSVYQARLESLKAGGKKEEVAALRRKLADLNILEAGLFDLKVIMTWDAMSDVDLDVIEPGGERVHHGNSHSKAGGHYYVDNTQGKGPETYTLRSASPGTYRIGAHLHGNTRSVVQFVVIFYEDTPMEVRREETLILEKGGEERFVRDLVIP